MVEAAVEPRRILVIEDNPADANLLRIALERTGSPLEVQVIADGMRALNYFDNATSKSGADCDLVLLDLNVPIINGFEILERIKSQRNLQKIPVIIFSSSSSYDDIERCYQAGANSYLCKPSGLTEFFDMVSGMVTYWLGYAKLPSRPGTLKLSSRIS